MKTPAESRISAATVAVAAMVVAILLPRAARAVTSAEFYTPSAYRYGLFEARVLFPPADGVVGSFFLWKNGSEMAGMYWNELDFEKIKGDCTLQINSHYGAPMAEHPQIVSNVSGLCTAYHTYGYAWTPTYIAWIIDGVEVRRDTGAAAQAYVDNAAAGMQVRFNMYPGIPNFGGTFSAASLPVYEFISWAQYSFYTPGAGDGGSDFTLGWRESFENGLPASWAMGNWASPYNLSTHSPANVTASGGVAVLSLTADDATGFSGTPPADPEDMPSAHPPAPDAGALDASAPAADAAAPSPDAGAPKNETGGGGCSCAVAGAGSSPATFIVALAGLFLAVRRRGRS